ncbi:putative ribonuclease H-like domain-containing protein [Tanacetum coccineum]
MMTISDLKSKLEKIKKGEDGNTRLTHRDIRKTFYVYHRSNKNLANKLRTCSNTKVPISMRSKPQSLQSLLPQLAKKQQHNGQMKSNVKRALFTSLVAAKSKGLGATSVVAKSRFNIAKTPTVIQLILWIVDSGCSKHMTSNLQLLRNFVEKFMGTVRFGNDHFAAITGYGKSKKASLPPKLAPSIKSKLELLYMDLCGPMRVASINGKKYILVIVDDYSRYTWVYFLRTKDEALNMIIDFINQVQRNLKAQIRMIRTHNGTEFKNEKLRAFYAKLGIVHQTSIARTPQQNGVLERRNRTLVEAARIMLVFSKAPEFL